MDHTQLLSEIEWIMLEGHSDDGNRAERIYELVTAQAYIGVGDWIHTRGEQQKITSAQIQELRNWVLPSYRN